jgi:putative oxygen-independent coproporphyrinogen III oxidase
VNFRGEGVRGPGVRIWAWESGGPAPARPWGVPSGSAFGVYVHIPFCASRCDYCDFATWTDRDHLVDEYVAACITDVARRRAEGVPAATSVFFGGGTPSLIPGSQLARILDAIERTPDAEVTVECNPDSVDAAKFDAYRSAGVNRLSFGVQSMVPHVLAALGRTHDPANVRRAVELARAAGFERISVDLIYGTPGESSADWQCSLDGALELEVEHVSAYALTVEPATALGRQVAAGAPAPDDDLQADAYARADDTLAAAGLEWYEVSNWARPGEECRHNELYWTGGDYLAIGCAAHGHTAPRRWWNVRTPERYIAAIDGGTSAVGGDELLDPETRAEEAFALALRTRKGTSFDGRAAPTVADLDEHGLLDRTGDRIVLTRRGRLLASDLTARLLLGGAAPTLGPPPAPPSAPASASPLLSGTRYH